MKQITPRFVGIVTKSEASDNFIGDVRKLLKNHSFNLVRRGMNPNRVQFLKDGANRRRTVGQSITVSQASYFRLYLNLKPRTIGYRDAGYQMAFVKAKTVFQTVCEIYKQNNIQLSK